MNLISCLKHDRLSSHSGRGSDKFFSAIGFSGADLPDELLEHLRGWDEESGRALNEILETLGLDGLILTVPKKVRYLRYAASFVTAA